jgi:hypothetical protein
VVERGRKLLLASTNETMNAAPRIAVAMIRAVLFCFIFERCI